MSELADLIIVAAASAYVIHLLANVISEISIEVSKRVRRAKRAKLGMRFATARRAARIECEARMRAEGYWDNDELERTMRIAGEKAAPGFRP